MGHASQSAVVEELTAQKPNLEEFSEIQLKGSANGKVSTQPEDKV